MLRWHERGQKDKPENGPRKGLDLSGEGKSKGGRNDERPRAFWEGLFR